MRRGVPGGAAVAGIDLHQAGYDAPLAERHYPRVRSLKPEGDAARCPGGILDRLKLDGLDGLVRECGVDARQAA